VRSSQNGYATGNAMLKFFNWGLTNTKGIKDARALNFVPLPSVATRAIEKVWHSHVKAGTKPCW
jgi:hypothetical protein